MTSSLQSTEEGNLKIIEFLFTGQEFSKILIGFLNTLYSSVQWYLI